MPRRKSDRHVRAIEEFIGVLALIVLLCVLLSL